ncbi:MAG: BamA/TamA family outer membrane protein [Kiritimatiellae bacterium]|nr:BamA/TamA family outer membrane protein [Kiritimatiellia bacterium]
MKSWKLAMLGAVSVAVTAFSAYGDSAGVALEAAQGKVAEAKVVLETAQSKVAESIKSVAVAKEALAKAKADKAVAPDRVKELKGQLKAAEAALDENKAAAKTAAKALEKAEKGEAAAKKAKMKAEADAKAKAEQAKKAKESAEAKAAEEKRKAEEARLSKEERERRAKEKAAEAAKKAEASKAERKGRQDAADKLREANAELEKAARGIRAAEDDYALASKAKELGEQRKLAEKAVADAKEALENANVTLKQANERLAATQEAVKTAKGGRDAAAVKGAEEALNAAKADQAGAANAARMAEKNLSGAKAALASIKVPNAISVDDADARHKAAYEEYGRKLNAKNEAERKFLESHPLRVTTTKRRITTPDEAKAVLAKECPNYQFVGDIVWLASTLVNGRPLCQAFTSGDANEDIKTATADAVNAGFYFAGFQDNGEKAGSHEILVDKGRIGAINVNFFEDDMQEIPTTNSNYSVNQIARKMGNGRISRGASTNEVFNFNAINDRFEELNGNPDIKKANIVFTPSTNTYAYAREDGSEGQNGRAVTMDVNVTEEEFPLHMVIGLDNFSSVKGDDNFKNSIKDEDGWMGHVTAQYLNLWGADHILTLNGSSSLRGALWGVSGGYLIPRKDNGKLLDWNWTLHGGYTKVDEEAVVEGIDVEGMGYFGGLQASRRLRDTGRSTLDFSLGLTYRYVESSVWIKGLDNNSYQFRYGHDKNQNNIVDDGEDGYKILPASLALMYSETALDALGGRNYATLEWVYNLGGSDVEQLQGFRPAIDDDKYWLARAQVARIQLLGDYEDSNASGLYSLFMKADAQHANTAIVSAEQFSVGGHNSVRGYKERQFLGDSGASATLELRSPIFTGIFHRHNVKTDVTPFDRWQFLAFVDVGWFDLEKNPSAQDNDSEFIAGAGVGFRLALGDNMQMRCDVATPLKRGDDDDDQNPTKGFETDDVRIYLSMQAQF